MSQALLRRGRVQRMPHSNGQARAGRTQDRGGEPDAEGRVVGERVGKLLTNGIDFDKVRV